MKLPHAETLRILATIEEELVQHPASHPVLKGRFAGLRKLRIGDYRVIYAILGDDVVILRIGHRGKVYKDDI
jgi:mRNA interferase RelE/StbE